MRLSSGVLTRRANRCRLSRAARPSVLEFLLHTSGKAPHADGSPVCRAPHGPRRYPPGGGHRAGVVRLHVAPDHLQAGAAEPAGPLPGPGGAGARATAIAPVTRGAFSRL